MTAIRSLVFALFFALPVSPGLCQESDEGGVGTLMLRGDAQSPYVPALFLDTHLEVTVTGLVARVNVIQSFVNVSDQWMEGVYLLPLPEKAAVDQLTMHIGDRRVEGEIQEKAAARRSYEQATAAGHRASLVEQQSGNLFRTQVSNIAPGEVIQMEVGFFDTVAVEGERLFLRLPLTRSPKFGGSTSQTEPTTTGTQSAFVRGEQVVSLHLELAPGIAVSQVTSRYHDVDITQKTDRYQVEFEQPMVSAARDFELEWIPVASKEPLAALFWEDFGAESYAMLLLMPPQPTNVSPQPREVIFVVDTSGSMHGTSLVQATAALDLALDRLRPTDAFNLIEFNSFAFLFSELPIPASPENIAAAGEWVNKLESGGGTEMAPALLAALSDTSQPDRLRQVVFITDGSVAYEQQLFELIKENLGESRLFTVGIGAAPNGYFLRGAARFGRGSYTYVSTGNEVAEKMSRLFVQLEYPAITDLCVNWPQQAERFPATLPDLYAGQPLLVTARLGDLSGPIELCGTSGDKSWKRSLVADDGTERSGIATLWARDKIEHLLDAKAVGADADQTRDEVLSLALIHQLISPYTSMVAVDRTPARSQKAALKRQQLQNAPPVTGDSVGLGQTALGLPSLWLLALAGLILAVTAHRGDSSNGTSDQC